MLSNTYLPFVGGVERSIDTYVKLLRARGNRVIIVAPEFQNMPENEEDVIRIPAVQKFNGTDFSVQLPIPGRLTRALKGFSPDVVHSHHPYLVGDTAHRLAAKYEVPIVFTFHTFYERYTHYVPGDSPAMKRFVVSLSTGYANICNRVIAPSRAVADTLKKRGVRTPVRVLPTPVNLDSLGSGNGRLFRKRYDIPKDAPVMGFVSRIAAEKNIRFLARSVRRAMKLNSEAYFVVVGTGPLENELKEMFDRKGLGERFRMTGMLEGQALVNAYHAMDVFAFASTTETQGLVVTEALASGTPVVALDAPAVSEVVNGDDCGRLVPREDETLFGDILNDFINAPTEERARASQEARRVSERFSENNCVQALSEEYRSVCREGPVWKPHGRHSWEETMRLIRSELNIVGNMTKAVGAAINDTNSKKPGVWL